MMGKQAENPIIDTFIEEHKDILSQADQLIKLVDEQLTMLQTYPKAIDSESIEKLIEWKVNLKEMVKQFTAMLKEHVKREMSYLYEQKLEQTDLLKNEEVTEHMDEMAWLLDNTPVRQIPVFKEYFHQKLDELHQGIIQHCKEGNRIFTLDRELPQER
jgi:hypothetical protein